MKTTLDMVSRLPVPTWNWLSINHTNLSFEGEAAAYRGDPVKSRPKAVQFDQIEQRELGPLPVILQETARFVEKQKNHGLTVTIPAGETIEAPIALAYDLGEDGNALVNELQITAQAGSRAKLVVQYRNGGPRAAFHGGYITVTVAEHAQLDLTFVQLLGSEDVHADALRLNVGKGAKVNLLLAELGARQAISAADVTLLGEGAEATVQSLYAAGDAAVRDLNYRISFAGKETHGEIIARGALAGSSRKTLKSTIDFQRGAAGAKGREAESVLVLSDKVRNISTPLLLCGEDNVEGQHATNIGRPDREQLYYLMSRGLDEKAARKLLVEASLAPILEQVQDEPLRAAMEEHIREVVESET